MFPVEHGARLDSALQALRMPKGWRFKSTAR